MSDKYLDYAIQLAAGALAGGKVDRPEEAVDFAEDCYKHLVRLGERLEDLEQIHQANGI